MKGRSQKKRKRHGRWKLRLLKKKRKKGGSSDFLAVADESVLVEILSRLPLKSIHRFKCVSKEWNALTRSSYFLNRQRLHSSCRLLLISSPSLANRISAGVSLLADEETALSSLNVPFLPSDARWSIDFVGSSNGLVCCNQFLDRIIAATIVWNPVTDEYYYFHMQLGNVLENATRYPLTGFDFMHSSNVYKLVLVELFGSDDPDDPLKISFSASVFTQGTPSWRLVESTFELGSCKMCYTNRSITVNGVLYWLVKDTSNGFAVVSFSLHDEEFNGLLKFVPEEIRYKGENNEPPLLVSWKNSLAVVGCDQGNNYVLWVDSTADQESDWTEEVRIKRSSIDEGHWLVMKGVWKDQFVFSTKYYDEAGADEEPDNLFLFDPITETLRKVHGETSTYFTMAVSYAESNVPTYSN